jgi:His/Glu/Gln/Arg/opine family amino acid ABC transporter permease subunit
MDVIFQQWPRFLNALWLTVWMFTLVTIVSTFIGAALAILAGRLGPVLAIPLSIYTWIFRGVPELVILLICYLALPYLGLDLGSIGSAILAFVLIGVAFQSEIFRAGLSTIDDRMIEAARGLGMSWWLMTRRVIIPQVLRVSVPSWATFLAGNVKAFALASAVAVTEIMTVTRQTMAISKDPFTLILLAALLYGAIASVLMVLEIVISRYLTHRYGPAHGGGAT